METTPRLPDLPDHTGDSWAETIQKLATELPREPEIKLRDPIEARTGEALRDCDFEPTPELENSMRDFFKDHYSLLEDIDATLTEDPLSLSEHERMIRINELQSIVDQHFMQTNQFNAHYQSALTYGNMPPAIPQLIHPFLARIRQDRLINPNDEHLKMVEIMMLAKASEALFAESSVAITTITETERTMVRDIKSKVLKFVEQSGFFDYNGGVIKGLQAPRSINTSSLRNPDATIDNAQKVFWNDCRYAGQLLFHNSGDMPRTRQKGMLSPRRMQMLQNGTMHIQTAETVDNEIHSPMVHWSEVYSHAEYKGGKSMPNGTIAMPLWKIIQQAPFGRDAHYGKLKVKPDHLDQFKTKIRLIDIPGTIGVGVADHQGQIGIDRSFYSSPHDAEPTAPIEEAPDGHSFPLDNRDYAVVLNEEEMYTVAQSGLGYGFPQPYSLDIPDIPDARSWRTMSAEERSDFQEERDKQIAAKIAELQHDSAARWPDEFVIPMRSGVMEFDIGDDGRYEGRNSAEFTKQVEAQQTAA